MGGVIPAFTTIVLSAQARQHARGDRIAAQEARRDEHRLALIASWREGLAALVDGGEEGDDGQRVDIFAQAWYMSLMPHLAEGVRETVEPQSRTLVLWEGPRPLVFTLAEEIARIEGEWGLR